MESEDLKPAVQRYKERFGHYPESVNADKIYWKNENRRYLKSQKIEMYGGNPLGRPSKSKTPQEKKHHKLESVKRNRIEGMFGLGKRRFGLGLVMAKTRRTSESWIAMVIFVMNVAAVYRDHIFSYFFSVIGHRVEVIRSISPYTVTKFVKNLRTCWKVRTRTQMQLATHFQKLTF